MVAVGSKSIPEKQSISVGVSKNSENNLENELFGDIFASTTLDTKKNSLSSDNIETDEVEIAKQEHQVKTSSISNEDSQINSNSIESSKVIGKLMADFIKKQKIENVAFDRSGYKYHGKIKALADSMRENGVKI